MASPNCSQLCPKRRRARIITVLLACSIGSLADTAAAASPPGPEIPITATDNDNSDLFGRSVDVFGEFAVVGAPGDDEEANGAGAAYVFRRLTGGWQQVQKLTATDDAEQFDEFGTDVAIERNLIAVGAPGDDDAGNDAGAVYVFEWNGTTWTEVEKLLPDDANNAGYAFGTAVDISIEIPQGGSVELSDIAVGAPRADTFDGVIFLFELISSNWTRIGRFNDSDTGAFSNGEFGSSVAIRGDSLLGGAPLDDQSGNNTGAAYLFGRDNINNIWSEVDQFYATNPAPGDQFGASVALEIDIAVVGSPAPAGGNSGRVFIYDLQPMPTEFTVGAPTEQFGSSVTIDGTTIVVGTRRDDDNADNAGSITFLSRDAMGFWQVGTTTQASTPTINQEFGESVAFRSGILVVGAGEESAITPGTAFIFDGQLFLDGFESGDVTAWSSQVP